jgi:hypothetical protein
MTIVTTYKAFAATYATHRVVPALVKRQPKVCLPTKTMVAMPSSSKRDIEEEEDERARLASLQTSCAAPAPPSTVKVWKVMHHPEWGTATHPEPEEFFALGRYCFCISNGSTPSSILEELKDGHRMVVQPKTMVSSRGKRLKGARGLNEHRYGTIMSDPRLDPDSSPGKPWYYVNVEWSQTSEPFNPLCKSNPCKTFTLIK